MDFGGNCGKSGEGSGELGHKIRISVYVEFEKRRGYLVTASFFKEPLKAL